MSTGKNPIRFTVAITGFCAGAVTAAKWRPLVKGALKTGIVGTARLTRTALRCAEDIADVIHEARFELSDEFGVDVHSGRPGPDAGHGSITAMAHGR